MHEAFEKQNWNAVGLTAIHCMISATDAVLAYTAGIRSISRDHREMDFLKF